MILHTADLHIGASKHILPDGYLERQKRMLYEIKNLVEKNQVRFLVIAGDVFEKGTPTQDEKDSFMKWLAELDSLKFCDIIMIAGNHDEASADRTALDTVMHLNKKLRRVHLALTPKNFAFPDDGITFACIPWNYDIDEWSTKLYKSLETKEGKFAVVGHLPLPGITTDTGWYIKGSTKLLEHEFVDAYLLGDIHARAISKCGKLQMPGSPIQHNWGDKTGKGVSLIKLDKLTSPQLVKLNVPEFEVVKDVAEAKTKAKKGSIVKLVTNEAVDETLPDNIVEVANYHEEKEVVEYDSEFDVMLGLPEFLAEKGLDAVAQKQGIRIIEGLCKELG